MSPRSASTTSARPRSLFLLGVVAAISAIVFFSRIGGSLADWDEALYAEQAREILALGDWLTPRWNFEPWFEKPPLVLWLTAAAYIAFGPSGNTARGVSAFFGVGTVLLTFLLGTRLQSRRVGLIAAAILMSLPQFQTMSRQAMLDVPVTFFSTWAALLLWCGYRAKRFSVWLGVAVGLGVLTKGFPGLLSLLASLVLFLITERRLLVHRGLWRAITLAILVNVPWHLAMVILHGREFVDTYILRNIVTRAVVALEGNRGDDRFYLRILEGGLGGYAYLGVVAMLWLLLRAWKEKRPSDRFLLVQAATVIIIFSLVQTKLPWYVVPLLPHLAIVLAILFEDYLAREVHALVHIGVTSAFGVIVFKWASATTTAAPWSLVLATLAGGTVLLADMAVRNWVAETAAFHAPIAALLTVGLILGLFRIPARQDTNHASRLIGECVKRLATAQDPVLVFHVDTPGLIYYSERRLKEIHSLDGIEARTDGSVRALLICRPGACEDLVSAHWRPVFTTGRARLFVRGSPPTTCPPSTAPPGPLIARRLAPSGAALGQPINPGWDGRYSIVVDSSGAGHGTLIYFAGQPLPTNFHGASKLHGTFDAGMVSKAGVYPVQLQDGARMSESLPFTVYQP
ncbi:MAG: ArnT family glycosyltransferase [Gammaproteobacteria bacterium]